LFRHFQHQKRFLYTPSGALNAGSSALQQLLGPRQRLLEFTGIAIGYSLRQMFHVLTVNTNASEISRQGDVVIEARPQRALRSFPLRRELSCAHARRAPAMLLTSFATLQKAY
jgi:hypothetical protein